MLQFAVFNRDRSCALPDVRAEIASTASRSRVALTGVLLALLLAAVAWFGAAHGASRQCVSPSGHLWPDGTATFDFENLEGLILVTVRLHGANGRDTTGPVAMDTGAGYLALDRGLAHLLGLADTMPSAGSIAFVPHSLPRLELGPTQIDQLSPVLALDLEMPRQVTDRPVLGLLGQRAIGNRVMFVDYRQACGAFVAPSVAAEPKATRRSGGAASDTDPIARALADSHRQLGSYFTRRAVAVPFRLAGDGKILIDARIGGRGARGIGPLTWILDTGATKCVLFEDRIDDFGRVADRWPALRGLAAPTLLGPSKARVARVPSIEVAPRGPVAANVDVAVLRSELSDVLSRAVGEPVHGLLGYSFLRRFRYAIDYPHRVLWLDPRTDRWNDRPFEYVHVGIQLERRGRALVVIAVAEDSPADRAGIAPGDQIVAIDGRPAAEFDVISASRYFEGRPGSTVRLAVSHGGVEKPHLLVRRRLL